MSARPSYQKRIILNFVFYEKGVQSGAAIIALKFKLICKNKCVNKGGAVRSSVALLCRLLSPARSLNDN